MGAWPQLAGTASAWAAGGACVVDAAERPVVRKLAVWLAAASRQRVCVGCRRRLRCRVHVDNVDAAERPVVKQLAVWLAAARREEQQG